MSTELNIPFGLCEISYGDFQLPSMGSEGEFKATPKYKTLHGGKLNSIQGYILEEYQVTFEVEIEHESYETLKLHMQTLQDHEHGLFDNPSNVNMEGKRLIIHPYSAGDSKEYDLCIWNAYIDPETVFERIYGKINNTLKVKFIGQPVSKYSDSTLEHSYFFIGDWSKVGAMNA